MILLVPGFASDKRRFSPLERELKAQGFDVLTVQRSPKRFTARADAAYASAIFHQVKDLLHAPTTIMAHSYGFLAASAFIRRYHDRLPWLQNVTLIGVAPTGLIGRSTYGDLMKRFNASIKSEADLTQFENLGDAKLVHDSGLENFYRYRQLAIAEGLQVALKTVRLSTLRPLVKEVVLLGFKEDALIPAERLLSHAPEAVILEHSDQLTHNTPLYRPKRFVELAKSYFS